MSGMTRGQRVFLFVELKIQFMSTHAMKVITVWLVYLPDGAGMRQWG